MVVCGFHGFIIPVSSLTFLFSIFLALAVDEWFVI